MWGLSYQNDMFRIRPAQLAVTFMAGILENKETKSVCERPCKYALRKQLSSEVIKIKLLLLKVQRIKFLFHVLTTTQVAEDLSTTRGL